MLLTGLFCSPITNNKVVVLLAKTHPLATSQNQERGEFPLSKGGLRRRKASRRQNLR